MALQDEINFLTLVNMLAQKYNLTYEVDFDTKTLNFVGDSSNEYMFAQEIADVMGEPPPINPS